MDLQPVHEVAQKYRMDIAPFIRGIQRGRLRAEMRDGVYFTSVAWMEDARALYGLAANGGR